MGQGNYVNFSVAAVANTTGLLVAKFTPATAANSWNALTGTVTAGTTTYTSLHGGFDLFVRPNATASGDQYWFRPIDLDSRSGNSGTRIIVTGLSTGLQFQLVSNGTNAFSADGVTWNKSSETMSGNYIFASKMVNHVGLTLNTDPGTGLVTVSLYAVPSAAAIDTSSTANLVSTMTFYENAAVTGSNALGTGLWSIAARTAANWIAASVDYDTVRLYDSAPGIFLANGAASPAGTAPTITTGPQSVIVSVGQTATFTVAATGAPAPGYQWRKNGTLIVGATSATYTTPPTLLSDNGSSFSVVVNNTAGSVTSGTAMLTVNPSYQSWAGTYFSAGQLSDPTVSGLTAKVAGDSMSNLLKYALGLNPNVNGFSQMPAVTVQGSAGARYLQISYRQQKSATDITYTVQVCGDVSGWQSGTGYTAPVDSPADNGDGTQTVVVRDVITSGPSQPRRFIRLQVTKP